MVHSILEHILLEFTLSLRQNYANKGQSHKQKTMHVQSSKDCRSPAAGFQETTLLLYQEACTEFIPTL